MTTAPTPRHGPAGPGRSRPATTGPDMTGTAAGHARQQPALSRPAPAGVRGSPVSASGPAAHAAGFTTGTPLPPARGNVMPESPAPHQSATATRPRLSGNGSAPLPAQLARPQRHARLDIAITRLHGMRRRIARRPQPR